MLKLKLFLSAICIFVTPAYADVVLESEDLYDACTRPDKEWIAFCNGFFQAASDAATLRGIACVPAGTTRTELVTIFDEVTKLTFEQDDEIRNTAGLELAIAVIARAYPCE